MLRAAACLLVLSLACTNTDINPGANPPPGGPPSQALPVTVGTTEAEVLSSQPPAGFDVLQIRDLWVAVRVPSILDVARLEIQTFMPDGTLFSTYRAAYSADPVKHPQASFPGYAIPADTRRAHMNGSEAVLTYPITISGSDYVRHAAPGTWKARLTVDGAHATEFTFDLGKAGL